MAEMQALEDVEWDSVLRFFGADAMEGVPMPGEDGGDLRQLVEMRQWTRAANLADAISTTAAEVDLDKAQAYLHVQRFEEAESVLEKYLVSEKVDETLLFEMRVALVELRWRQHQSLDQCRADCMNLLDSYTHSNDQQYSVLLVLAQVYTEQERLKHAFALLTKCLSLAQDDTARARVLVHVVRLRIQCGLDAEQIMEDLEMLAGRGVDQDTLLVCRGLMAASKRDADTVLALLNPILSSEVTSHQYSAALHCCSSALIQQGRFLEAVELLESHVRMYPFEALSYATVAQLDFLYKSIPHLEDQTKTLGSIVRLYGPFFR